MGHRTLVEQLYLGLVDLFLVTLVVCMIGLLVMIVRDGLHDRLNTNDSSHRKPQDQLSISPRLYVSADFDRAHPRVPNPCLG